MNVQGFPNAGMVEPVRPPRPPKGTPGRTWPTLESPHFPSPLIFQGSPLITDYTISVSHSEGETTNKSGGEKSFDKIVKIINKVVIGSHTDCI